MIQKILASDKDIYVVLDKRVILLKEGETKVLYTSEKSLGRVACLNHRRDTLLLSEAESKRLVLLSLCSEEDSAVVKTIGCVEKSPMCASFTINDDAILVGDKFGDLYSFSLSSTENAHGELLAGCVSMILDVLPLTERYIVFADRNEKVRLLNAQKPYIIDGFLLGHTEYVSKVIALSERVLLSVGGDAKINVWDLSEAMASNFASTPLPIQTVSLKTEEGDMTIIDPIDCCISTDKRQLIVILEAANYLLHFTIDEEHHGLSEKPTKITFPEGFVATTAIFTCQNDIVIGGYDRSTKQAHIAIKSASSSSSVFEYLVSDSKLSEVLSEESISLAPIRNQLRKKCFNRDERNKRSKKNSNNNHDHDDADADNDDAEESEEEYSDVDN